MSGRIPSLTILSEEQKFNRENLLQWKMNVTQLLGSKGLLGFINGSILKPVQPDTSETTVTAVPSATPILLNTVTNVMYHTSLLIDCVILLLVSRCTTPGT